MFENIFNSDNQGSTTSISNGELADLRGQLAAINKFQSIAEFTMDGKVITANENYLMLTGYTSSELAVQHIGMLLDLKYRNSAENTDFWETLNRGECIAGQFKRITKGGRAVWIQAAYYPMIDLDGKPFKVVEYATDVTEQVQLAQALAKTAEQVQEVVLAVKNGDLRQRIPLEGKTGEIASLCNDVNSLVGSMAAIIALINKAGGSIIAAANKISDVNKNISQRREKQESPPEDAATGRGGMVFPWG